MRRQLLLLSALALTCVGAAAAQTITPGSLEMTDISHSSARILFGTTGSWSSARLRIVTGATGCEGGSGGVLYIAGNGSPSEPWKGKSSIAVVALAPATTFDACPEVSANGTNWFGGVGISFTTSPLPAVHPAPPRPPVAFNTNYPDTTGFIQLTAASNDDCSSVTSALQTAINGSLANGYVITVPAGSVCIGTIYPNTMAPDVQSLTPSAFNTTNWTITSPNHGLAEGQALQWTASLNSSPYGQGAMPGADQPVRTDAHPFDPGAVTYAHVVDANTIQVYAYAPYGAPCPNASYSGGAPCPQLWKFTNAGGGLLNYAKWPRAVKPIIVQSSAVTDGTFLPEHVRAGPNWAPRMASFQVPNSKLGCLVGARCVGLALDTGDDASNHWFLANLRFVGIELTYQPYPQAALTNDLPPGMFLLVTGPGNSGIVFDRCWIHGYPAPFRTYKVIQWQGMNEAFVDTTINQISMPRQWNIGLGVSAQ